MDGNRWIMTAIDYATGWPIAKAIPKATEEAIAEFIHDEIYNIRHVKPIICDFPA